MSPSSGTLPAVLTVSVDLALIRLYNPKKIVINGPQNDITIPVNLKVSGLQANPASFAFSAKEGSAAQTQTLRVDLASNVVSPLTVSVSMDSDSAWLSATVINTSLFLRVNIDPGRLPAGQYTGRIIVSAAGAGSVQIPVALTIWGTPPPLTVRPSTLTLKYPGSVSPQTLTVESAGVPLPLNILESQLLWMTRTSDVTPASISVSIRDIRFVAGAYEGVTEEPGEFHSSIQIATTGTTITVPVTILIEPRAPPVIGSVVNTASRIQRAIAPGEILTIHGYAAGPPNTLGFTLDPSGTVATSYNGTQVLFDGKPAPLLYASPYQTNLVVPFEVADRKSTNIEVVYNGAKSAAWGLPVAPASPAIFTSDEIGVGQAAALNQDNSVNSASNPAARGTVTQIYATGLGQTSPPGVTGSLTKSGVKTPTLPVRVTIGGIEAPVQFAGSAPDSVEGLLQLNVLIPQDLTPGPAVPIAVTAGAAKSQDGVTIAVK